MVTQNISFAALMGMPQHTRSCEAAWQPRVVGHTAFRPWLLERGSLTARLKKHYPAFSVALLSQDWRKPYVDEQSILRINAACQAWVREVMLTGNGQSRVFAHSVIARQDLRGPWSRLRSIGRMPLGAALFANPRVRRGPLQFRKLCAHHPLHQTVCRYHPQLQQSPLWARRSLFCLHQHLLLVTEVFLPACVEQDNG
ncbi:chorismate--pyruvate lyase family protein [Methylophilus sp. 3sh_L]|uniref:chorismate--pyruvate lyase family protein n=1 Tax=Methylophilus sp. 3sh_L TaxID=3377114 RepID=UPI00398E992B